MKIIQLLLILGMTQTICIYASTDTKTDSKVIPIEKTIFVNGRMNNIWLTITDNKNVSFQIVIKIGNEYEYYHKPQIIKKVVCSEKLAPNITINKTDLDTYAAFAFNVDKLEKYHFITIKEKEIALKRARDAKNETLFQEISEQNVYNP